MQRDEKIKIIFNAALKIYLVDLEEQKKLPVYKTDGIDLDELIFDSVDQAYSIFEKTVLAIDDLSDKK